MGGHGIPKLDRCVPMTTNTCLESRRELGDAQHKAHRDQETAHRAAERLSAQLAEAERQVASRDVEISQLKKEIDGVKVCR